MVDFSQHKKLDINSEKSVEYVFPELDGEVTLMVTSASESNKPYFNALLKRARRTSKIVQAGSITANVVSNNRNEDRELYALHIIKGWKNVLDATGKQVIFNQQNCLDFLKAIPDYIFDELRAFCGNLINFIDEGATNVEETAKN